MSVNQGLRQAFFRAISGTTTDYNGDFLAAAAVDGFTGEFNGVFIEWLQDRTGSSSTNLDGLKQEFAELAGAHNWESTGGVPIILEGCQAWFDPFDEASVLRDGSNKVSRESDKSGKSNDATQGAGADQGTWTENSINGLPAIVMSDNHHLIVADDASLNFDGGTGYTIFMVVDFDGYVDQSSSLNTLLGKGASQLASDNYNLQTNSGNGSWFQSGNNELILNAGGAINGSAHILTSVMDNAATNAKNFLDGGTETNNSAATVGSDNASDLIIGGDTGVIRYAAGKYGEIIIYNRPLLTPEISVVHNYLSTKWGITLA